MLKDSHAFFIPETLVQQSSHYNPLYGLPEKAFLYGERLCNLCLYSVYSKIARACDIALILK